MDWQERYLDSLNENIRDIKESLRRAEGHVENVANQLLEEFKGFKGELRDELTQFCSQMESQRLDFSTRLEASRQEFNEKFEASRREFDARHEELKAELRTMNRWVMTMVISASLGIAAMVVAVLIK